MRLSVLQTAAFGSKAFLKNWKLFNGIPFAKVAFDYYAKFNLFEQGKP